MCQTEQVDVVGATAAANRHIAVRSSSDRSLSPVHTSNNVEATFDLVEKIVRLVAFDNVASVDGALETHTLKQPSLEVVPSILRLELLTYTFQFRSTFPELVSSF